MWRILRMDHNEPVIGGSSIESLQVLRKLGYTEVFKVGELKEKTFMIVYKTGCLLIE